MFTGDPVAAVLADRGAYVAACLISAAPTSQPDGPANCRDWFVRGMVGHGAVGAGLVR